MKNNRTTVKVCIAVTVLYVVATIIGVKALNYYNDKRIHEQYTETSDSIDQDRAIKQLSELRGMILEVKALSHEDIPQSVLLDELKSITSSNHFTNKYLDDFAFDIPNTSNVGELCEEFISQIDYQIHTIEYGWCKG